MNGHTILHDCLKLPFVLNDPNRSRSGLPDASQDIPVPLTPSVSERLIPSAATVPSNADDLTPSAIAGSSANEIAVKCFKFLIEECQLSTVAKKQLLLTKDDEGFSPLMYLLAYAPNKELFALYFSVINSMRRPGGIKIEEYVDLLVSANKAGFTPLHDVLNEGSPDNVRAYLEHINTAYQKTNDP